MHPCTVPPVSPPLTPQPVYRDLLPLYFPRTSEEEAYAAKALPEDVGESRGVGHALSGQGHSAVLKLVATPVC